MKSFSLLAGLVLSFVLPAHAVKLQDYQPYNYDVRFTNPQCATYSYKQPMISKGGETLTEKPKNVYCKKSDSAANVNRSGSPSEKLLEWINQEKTKEIFMTYLSFSNVEVTQALCKAMTERGVRVQLVMDDPPAEGATAAEDESRDRSAFARANELEACGKDLFDFYKRGHVSGIGFAHNKVFIVNPHGADDEIQISFGSGNMTAGIVLHHENWHFITTSRKSYFARAHLCLMDAEIDHGTSGRDFRAYMKSCEAAIDVPQEEDIQAFFVPGQGEMALKAITDALVWADEVKLAAHRFSYRVLIEALMAKLGSGTPFSVKLLFDDDIYWVRRPNTGSERAWVMKMEAAGAKPHYLETNGGHQLLHHNKFIVFKSADRKATFVGAGNFTGTAFSENWENFYFVTIPEVVDTMDQQYDHLYDDLATAPLDMPSQDILP